LIIDKEDITDSGTSFGDDDSDESFDTNKDDDDLMNHIID